MKAKIKLRTERENKKGLCPLALVVTLGGAERVVIGIEMTARREEIGPDGLFRGRGHHDKNLILQQLLARANEILVAARLEGRTHNAVTFRAEWNAPGGAASFVAYMERAIGRAVALDLLEPGTIASHRVVLNRLKIYAPGLRFHEVSVGWLEEFNAWTKQRVLQDQRARNGGAAALAKNSKAIKTYYGQAIRDGVYRGRNALQGFKVKAAPRRLVYLSREEMERFRGHLGADLAPGEREVLRAFLFSCFTGLRVSDLKRISPSNVVDNVLRMPMHKGRRRGGSKLLEVPLNRTARALLIEGALPLLTVSEPYANRVLKMMAARLSVGKAVTMHTGRHTFATLFLERDGSVEILQELLGHSHIQTTMVYVHLDKVERKVRQMDLLD